MAEVVEPDVAQPDSGAEPAPALRHSVGSPRLLTGRVAGKDELRALESSSRVFGEAQSLGVLFAKCLYRLSRERHEPVDDNGRPRTNPDVP